MAAWSTCDLTRVQHSDSALASSSSRKHLSPHCWRYRTLADTLYLLQISSLSEAVKVPCPFGSLNGPMCASLALGARASAWASHMRAATSTQVGEPHHLNQAKADGGKTHVFVHAIVQNLAELTNARKLTCYVALCGGYMFSSWSI